MCQHRSPGVRLAPPPSRLPRSPSFPVPACSARAFRLRVARLLLYACPDLYRLPRTRPDSSSK
eukprot:15370607-Heterocapsa_arctica.AAC.1